jgi:hypothetical protein
MSESESESNWLCRSGVKTILAKKLIGHRWRHGMIQNMSRYTTRIVVYDIYIGAHDTMKWWILIIQVVILGYSATS